MILALLILLVLVTLSLPVLLLLGLPVWGTFRLRRRGWSWLASLVPLLIPLATLATELYPVWLVQRIARDAMRGARQELVPSVYPEGGSAQEAARLVGSYSTLRFAEGVVDSVIRLGTSAPDWALVPDGPMRFSDPRLVKSRSECQDDEVIVWVGDPLLPSRPTLGCTRWQAVSAITASHALRSKIRVYDVGPYRVTQTRSYAASRADGREVNAILRVSITGGIWWHFTDWLGGVTGARLEAIHVIGEYSASTDDASGLRAFEEFLLTGRTQA